MTNSKQAESRSYSLMRNGVIYCLCRWKVDGRDINTDSDVNYSLVEGNLLISNPHVINHGGVYQCIATNSFGTVVSREAKVQFACEYMFIFKCAYCYSSETSHFPASLRLGVILCVTEQNANQLEWGCNQWIISFISIIISLVNHLIYLVFKISGGGENPRAHISYSPDQLSKPPNILFEATRTNISDPGTVCFGVTYSI